MTKSTKRAERRKALQPDPELSPSPPPAATVALAKAGVPINRGSSDKMPLSPDGSAEAKIAGEELAAKGGVDSITTDDSVRTQQTAQQIAAANGKPVKTNPNLSAWAQGNLEGKPKQRVQDHIDELIRKQPSHVIAGQGAMSTRPGESFDQFRKRVLTSVLSEMAQLRQSPQERRVIINHSSSGNLVKAWLAAGAQDNFKIDPKVMEQPAPKPGTVERLAPGSDGKWKMAPVNLKASSQLEPGIYFVHHGLTPQNEQTYKTANAKAQLLHQISAYARAHDWLRLKPLAERAVASGQLTTADIEKAVNGSLPEAGQFEKLPLDRQMAAASAAPDDKRSAYTPALQRSARAAQGTLPPHMGAEVLDHMRLLGLGNRPSKKPVRTI